MDHETAVGERIAYYRRRRGLTQEVLSGRVGRSAVWLSKIERGERTLDKVSLLLALARVLEVEPGDLIGGLELPPNGGAPHDHPQGIPAIRHAVEGVVDLREREAPTSVKLRADVDRAKQLDASGSYETLRLELPQLIVAGRAAVEQEVPGAWECLAGAYQTASSLARTVGEVDLAWIAADRAVTAAQQSGDQQLIGLSHQRLTSALMAQGWLDDAGAVVSDAADALAPTDETAPEGWSVWGLLHLVGALVAVRGEDVPTAWRVLRDARGAAERVGPGRNDYWEAFGPASVGTIEVAVALEHGDPVEALRITDNVEVDELPSAERRAHFRLTVAHAHVLRRDDAAAAAMLSEAERHAPEVVRYSVLARELMRVLLGRERRSRTPELRGLAQRLGIAD
ncbi:MAG: helix-turn-helix domain-containing protein [Egibacteraceae bacterium]